MRTFATFASLLALVVVGCNEQGSTTSHASPASNETRTVASAGSAPAAAPGPGPGGDPAPQLAAEEVSTPKRADRITKADAEWKAQLTKEQYYVLREKGTERAFTGATWDEHREGVYSCAACELPLFASATKFESGTGWPSFYQPIAKDAVEELQDLAHGMVRTEVVCARCGGHLGHVFDDGPKPTGLRYCMNSAAMKFTPAPGSAHQQP